MNKTEFEITNKKGNKIKARFIIPDDKKEKIPIVIMLTGDGPRGSKSLSWSNLPPRLQEKGIASLLFDFSGLGYSDGNRKELTLTQGIEDFKLVFEKLNNYSWIDRDRIGFMASSFGGSVLIHCYNIANCAKVIGLKSPSTFLPDAYLNEISIEDYNNWIKSGYCDANGYNYDVLKDCFNYNLYKDASNINVKTLISHGSKDEIVPYSQSLFLNDILQGESELVTFKDGDHGYSGENWEKMASLFIGFFDNNLN